MSPNCTDFACSFDRYLAKHFVKHKMRQQCGVDFRHDLNHLLQLVMACMRDGLVVMQGTSCASREAEISSKDFIKRANIATCSLGEASYRCLPIILPMDDPGTHAQQQKDCRGLARLALYATVLDRRDTAEADSDRIDQRGREAAAKEQEAAIWQTSDRPISRQYWCPFSTNC